MVQPMVQPYGSMINAPYVTRSLAWASAQVVNSKKIVQTQTQQSVFNVPFVVQDGISLLIVTHVKPVQVQ